METGAGFWAPWIIALLTVGSIVGYILMGVFLGRVFYNLVDRRWDHDSTYDLPGVGGVFFGMLWPFGLVLFPVLWILLMWIIFPLGKYVVGPIVLNVTRLADKATVSKTEKAIKREA